MKTAHDVIITPLLSEKAYAGFSRDVAEGTPRRYTFWVQKSSNKTEIKKAVEAAFKVKVVAVNVMNTEGKARRMGRFEGKKSDRKKAVVTVAVGQKIDALEGLV